VFLSDVVSTPAGGGLACTVDVQSSVGSASLTQQILRIVTSPLRRPVIAGTRAATLNRINTEREQRS